MSALLARLLRGYDALFYIPFSYSLGWHGTNTSPGFQLHAHVYPPLLRSERLKRHFVGYDLLAEAQRDFTPETAAARLRQVTR